RLEDLRQGGDLGAVRVAPGLEVVGEDRPLEAEPAQRGPVALVHDAAVPHERDPPGRRTRQLQRGYVGKAHSLLPRQRVLERLPPVERKRQAQAALGATGIEALPAA